MLPGSSNTSSLQRMSVMTAHAFMSPHNSSDLTHLRNRNVLKRNSMRFAAALLVALASLVAGLIPAFAAAPQHHDQVPGFYRLQVGDLEVTVLFDGFGAFNLQL
jgi:hypothetical protein